MDVDAIAQQLFFGAFFNTAQICVATKRLYIHENIHDAVRDRLHALAQARHGRTALNRGPSWVRSRTPPSTTASWNSSTTLGNPPDSARW